MSPLHFYAWFLSILFLVEGRSIYKTLICSLELWPGFITAIHQHETSVLLCADLTFKILRCDTVLEQLNDFLSKNPSNFRDDASKALIGAIVLARYV